MTSTIGSGLGGSVVIAPQNTYGAVPSFVSGRTLGTFKSFKPTYNPHPIQGGPYLRNGELSNIGSARVLTWLDAQGTLNGDMANTGAALLLASAFGSSGTLTQVGTTPAYQLGGAGGISLSTPDKTNTFIDLQAQVPQASAVLVGETYHSGYITKATWVFDRQGLVTYEYGIDFQYLEKTTALATVTEPGGPIPFSMGGSTNSAFKVGAFGSEAQTDGIRKCTISIERPAKIDRIYLGNQYKDVPVASDKVKLNVSLELDYTSAAKTALFDLFLAGTPTSIVCTSVMNQIASTASNDTFTMNVTNAFADTGGESPLDSPDLVHNTIAWSGTIDAAGDPSIKAFLTTADTTF